MVPVSFPTSHVGTPSSVIQLQSYKISDVTVSGLSSGAYMAVQMHISYSSLVNGSAIFAGGPFFCAQDNLIYAEDECMQTYMGAPNVNRLVSLTRDDAAAGTVDDLANLKDDSVYLFSGKDDTVVVPAVMQALQAYYEYFVDINSIVADFSIAAEHCLPTLNYGESCAQLKSPYIGKCNFDGAYQAFSTLYGSDIKSGAAVAANLFEFDQTPFFTSKSASIGSTGYIYVPTACQSGTTTCHLHMSFHGCEQTLDDIGNAYAANTGFNAWAENNNIIVVYPYVVSSQNNPQNPNGCWDWWGYTNAQYAYKTGVQPQFAYSILKKLTGQK